MKVLLFGSTGMIGQGVLRECRLDDRVEKIFTVVRSATGNTHDAKVTEIVHEDFLDFSSLEVDADVCMWCLGVTSAGMTEADYTRITHDFTLAAAKALLSPAMTFIFVSGMGADGSAMWARVKRKTEEDLQAMPFKHVYVFRPGMVQPLHGIRSRTRLYNALYPLMVPVLFLMKLVAPGAVTTTERCGRAMLNVATKGYPKKLLTNADINEAAGPDTA